MAKNLITKKQEIKAPSRPVIVSNLFSLPAGTEIHVAPEAYEDGEVVKAGTPVGFRHGKWEAYAENADVKGVLVNDCVAYNAKDAEGDPYRAVTGAIMLIGVVNAEYWEDDKMMLDPQSYLEFFIRTPIVVLGAKVDA